MPDSTEPVRVLMSPENPQGWTLEDLVERLKVEVLTKCDKIKDDARPQAIRVLRNNMAIIGLLGRIGAHQRDSLAALDQLGPYPGPTGTPRIGTGSQGGPS